MSLAVSRRAAISEVPMIDVSPMMGADQAARSRVAEQIGEAAETVGFFSIVNHGVPGEQIDGMFEIAQRFFALPLERKLSIQLLRSPYFRGYLPMNSVGYDRTKKGNLLEAFQVQLELGQDDPDVAAGKPLHGPNQWLDGMPELKSGMLAYWAQMDRVSDLLLRAFAMTVGVEETHFHQYFRKPLSQLRLLHYPPQTGTISEDQIGAAAHCDTGAFTILLQDDVGGLEVWSKEGEWIVVPPVQHSFVINIGDMMKRWTNGRFASTPHRVINRYGKERYSIPFFINGDYDAVVTPLPHLVPQGSKPKFGPLHCGEFITDRFREVWPTAGQNV